jgi:hypothetical protein
MPVPRITGAEQLALARLLDQIAAALLDRRTVPGGTDQRAELDGRLAGTLEGVAAELRGDDGRRIQHHYLQGRTDRLPAYIAELAAKVERAQHTRPAYDQNEHDELAWCIECGQVCGHAGHRHALGDHGEIFCEQCGVTLDPTA